MKLFRVPVIDRALRPVLSKLESEGENMANKKIVSHHWLTP